MISKNNFSKVYVFFVALIISSNSCCPKCKECFSTLKYDWKMPHKGIGIINMKNNTLIGSEIFYKTNADGFGNFQVEKDSGHYVIDKTNGIITDSILGFVPTTAENKYLHRVGKNTEKKGLLFTTEISQFTIAENYKGYKIVLQEWYKNIRASNNHVYSVLVYKGNRKISEKCLPDIFDFTFDENSFYIFSNKEIFKYNFDELVKRK